MTGETSTDLGVRVQEDLAFGSQLVDVGGFYQEVPIAAQGGPEVVCHDKQDILCWKQETIH